MNFAHVRFCAVVDVETREIRKYFSSPLFARTSLRRAGYVFDAQAKCWCLRGYEMGNTHRYQASPKYTIKLLEFEA